MGVRLGSHDDDDLPVNHEINVTPFIDVILVLLIIFMVAAPLATVDVPVDLPASTAAQQPRPDKPVYLTVKEDKSLVVGDEPTEVAGLIAAIDAATHSDKETRLFLRADKSVPYGDLMDTMNKLRDAGYLKIALVGVEQAARP